MNCGGMATDGMARPRGGNEKTCSEKALSARIGKGFGWHSIGKVWRARAKEKRIKPRQRRSAGQPGRGVARISGGIAVRRRGTDANGIGIAGRRIARALL